MSFLKKIIDKGPQVLEHVRSEAIGILNPNRRHDDPSEKAEDELRADIMSGHRFQSFATERTNNTVKWHIDGHDFMWALSEMLDNAKEAIFILDWWLTPELYLRRPPAFYPEWRLDKILKRKAEQGVKIYVIVYKEVTQTMSMCSSHTKHTLDGLHPNIHCLRHPDHIGAKDSIQFWSHHEKVVIVDNQTASIGGLDLCFGRWDTHNHPLADVHPTRFSRTLFPGQEYNNARIQDFKEVYNYASNTLSMLDNARMPWQDCHMTFEGIVVLDVAQHFVERWNEIKKRKYRTDDTIEWLALPHNVDIAPNEAVARHPHRERWLERGRKHLNRWHSIDQPDQNETEDNDPAERAEATCRVQVVRSVSDWSHGVLVEKSIQTAYVTMIREAKSFIYIENQFFISATKPGGIVVNLIAQALVERIIQAATAGDKFKVIICIPELPGFSGDVKDASAIKIIMAAQYRTINRGGDSIYEKIRAAGFEPTDYIRFYHLRSYDRINAPLNSFIKQMEQNSGVTFHEAQVALARQWVGPAAHTDQADVTIAIPSEGATDGIVATETKPKFLSFGSQESSKDKSQVTVPIPTSEEEARDIVRRFEQGAQQIRGDEDVSDSVAQHALGDETRLRDEKWLGTEEEELNAYVSELCYIHTKLMIVDDNRVIMGSANINDRSQKGDGDSEIALVVEDNDLIPGRMNGNPVMVAKFAATLRRKIFREHLGLIPPQNCSGPNDPVTSFMRPAPYANEDETRFREDQLVLDPLSDETLALWNGTAQKNREVFTELFRPVPTNLVRDWAGYDAYVSKGKVGHVAPGIPLQRVKEQLAQVKGTLVEAPLDFLIDQDDFVKGAEWSSLDVTLPIYI